MVTKLLFTAAIIVVVLFGWKFFAQLANQQGGKPGSGDDGGTGDGAGGPTRRLNRKDEASEDLEWDEQTKTYRPRGDRDPE